MITNEPTTLITNDRRISLTQLMTLATANIPVYEFATSDPIKLTAMIGRAQVPAASRTAATVDPELGNSPVT
jgi:hypothetical protein